MTPPPEVINQFNQPNVVLVISKYPVADQAASHHGVATYTQHLLRVLTKHKSTKFVILVEDTFCQESYLDNDQILIVPAFSDGYLYPAQILRAVATFSQIKLVHIHSEFITSGKPIQMALLMPLLLGLKLLRKQVFFTAHNVIDNFDFIAKHLGRSRQDWLLRFLQLMMPWYYWLLAHLVNTVIVLDSSIERRLQRVMPTGKLYYSPHWVHPVTKDARYRQNWRRKLEYSENDFVIVCFGFMTKYKGVDWLIEAVDHARSQIKNKNVKLILAGGRTPSQLGKAHYEQFYRQLTEKVAKTSHTILTGFVPERELSRYFSVADLIVLPYRGILGASGSWAQAIAHGKPFVLSKELEAYLRSSDVEQAQNLAGLTHHDMLFTRKKRHFANLVQKLIEQPTVLTALTAVSKHLALTRSAQQRIEIEHDQLYTPQSSWLFVKLTHARSKIQALPAFLGNR